MRKGKARGANLLHGELNPVHRHAMQIVLEFL